MGMKDCPPCTDKYGTNVKHGDKLPPCPNSGKGK